MARHRYLSPQVREGRYEAPIGVFIAVFSLLIAKPGTVTWSVVLLRLASAFTSVAMAMTGCSRANAILDCLQQDKNPLVLTDYATQEKAKSQLPPELKFGRSARVLGLAGLATCFAWSNLRLMSGCCFIVQLLEIAMPPIGPPSGKKWFSGGTACLMLLV